MTRKNYTLSCWSPGLVARTMFVFTIEVLSVLSVLSSRAAPALSSAGAASKSSHVEVPQIKNVYFYKTKLEEYEEGAQLIEKLKTLDMALHLSPFRYRTGIQQKKDGRAKSQNEKWYASRANGCYRYIWKAQTVTVLPADAAEGGGTTPTSVVVTLWFLVELLLDGHHYDHITGSAERRWKLALPQALTEVLEMQQQEPQSLKGLALAIREVSGFTLFDGQEQVARQVAPEQPTSSAGKHREDQKHRSKQGEQAMLSRSWHRQNPVIQENEVQILSRHLAIEADRAFQEAAMGPEATGAGLGAVSQSDIPLRDRITFISGPPGSGKSVQLLALLLKIQAEVPKAVGEGGVVLQYHTQSERLRNDVTKRLRQHYAVAADEPASSGGSSDNEQKVDRTTSREAMLPQATGISVQAGPLKLSELSTEQKKQLLAAVEQQPLHGRYLGAEEYRKNWGSEGLLDLYQMAAAICSDLDLFIAQGGLRNQKECRERIKTRFSRKINDMAAHLGGDFASHVAGAFLSWAADSAQLIADTPGPFTKWENDYENEFASKLRFIGGSKKAGKISRGYLAVDEAQNLSPMALAFYLKLAKKSPRIHLVFAFDRNQQLLGGLNDKRRFVRGLVDAAEDPAARGGAPQIRETALPEIWRSPPRLVPVLQRIANLREEALTRSGGAGQSRKEELRSAYKEREQAEDGGSADGEGAVVVALKLNKGTSSFAEIRNQFEDAAVVKPADSGGIWIAHRRGRGTLARTIRQNKRRTTTRQKTEIVKSNRGRPVRKAAKRRKTPALPTSNSKNALLRFVSSAPPQAGSSSIEVDTLDSMPWVYLDEDRAKAWDSDATSLSALQAQGQEWPVVVVADPHEFLSGRGADPVAVRRRVDGLAKLFVAISRATARSHIDERRGPPAESSLRGAALRGSDRGCAAQRDFEEGPAQRPHLGKFLRRVFGQRANAGAGKSQLCEAPIRRRRWPRKGAPRALGQEVPRAWRQVS
ncbi:unnamed protein product [Amoebophrya sp. A120]|nr:unnamed protein product [Amoebophrya sp. A120]|eukprot:GSA120T00001444001.1